MKYVLPFPQSLTFLQRTAKIYHQLQTTALLKMFSEGRLAELSDSPIEPEKWLTEAEYDQTVDDFNRRYPI